MRDRMKSFWTGRHFTVNKPAAGALQVQDRQQCPSWNTLLGVKVQCPATRQSPTCSLITSGFLTGLTKGLQLHWQIHKEYARTCNLSFPIMSTNTRKRGRDWKSTMLSSFVRSTVSKWQRYTKHKLLEMRSGRRLWHQFFLHLCRWSTWSQATRCPKYIKLVWSLSAVIAKTERNNDHNNQ